MKRQRLSLFTSMAFITLIGDTERSAIKAQLPSSKSHHSGDGIVHFIRVSPERVALIGKIKTGETGVIVLFSTIVAAFVCVQMRLGGVGLSAGALALALLLMLTLTCAGQVLLAAFGAYDGKAAMALALVTGFAAVSVLMVILTLLLK